MKAKGAQVDGKGILAMTLSASTARTLCLLCSMGVGWTEPLKA